MVTKIRPEVLELETQDVMNILSLLRGPDSIYPPVQDLKYLYTYFVRIIVYKPSHNSSHELYRTTLKREIKRVDEIIDGFNSLVNLLRADPKRGSALAGLHHYVAHVHNGMASIKYLRNEVKRKVEERTKKEARFYSDEWFDLDAFNKFFTDHEATINILNEKSLELTKMFIRVEFGKV